MKSRIARAREMAGLSRAQAARLLGWLCLYEEDGEPDPNESQLAALADLYGVSIAWLRGQPVELSESTRDLLRSVEPPGERARLTELLEAVQGRPR